MVGGRLLQVATPPDLWRAPVSREVASFLGYEAFVDADSEAAGPLRDALGSRDSSGSTIALAEGAFVVSRPVLGLSGTADGRPPSAKGTVTGVASRRGRSEVRVEVDGIGAVTALGPVGGHWSPGDVVELAVEPDALAVLPL